MPVQLICQGLKHDMMHSSLRVRHLKEFVYLIHSLILLLKMYKFMKRFSQTTSYLLILMKLDFQDNDYLHGISLSEIQAIIFDPKDFLISNH